MVLEMGLKEISRLSEMAIIKKKMKSLEPLHSKKMERSKRREPRTIILPLEPNSEKIKSKRRSK